MNGKTLFYRVLYTSENQENWRNGFYSSGHCPPTDWFSIWELNKSTEPNDYPLLCSTGYYSATGRSVFINAAKNGRLKAMTANEAKAICELGGVCAWDTPNGAICYLEPTSPARRLGSDRYVEFWGVKLADDSVEGLGAVIARVQRAEGAMYSREAFMVRHKL